MRKITKHEDGGYYLNQSNDNPPINKEQVTKRWKNFDYKKETSKYLNEEQYYLCAYSEIRPDLVDLDTHIEHIQPKNAYPLKTFDYQNLVITALSSADLKNRAKDDVFGGHSKLGDYDQALFISPLQNDCSQYFVYLSDGRVEPSNKLNSEFFLKAEYTINLLNLNSPFLVIRRKKWLDELGQLIDQHLTHHESLYHLARIDLIPHQQKLSPFFTATRQIFSNLSNTVLNDYAPELR